MEYKNFIKLLRNEGNVTPETLAGLQELAREFPYFQPAHILLAKAMKEQEHLRYEKQLKLASAYAADRRVLFSLIHDHAIAGTSVQHTTDDEALSPFTLEETEETESKAEAPLSDRDLENPFISIPFVQEPARTVEEAIAVPENPVPAPEESVLQPRYQADTDEHDMDDSSGSLAGLSGATQAAISDPREVIRRRLAEILGNPEEPATDKSTEEAGIKPESKPEAKVDKVDKIEDQDPPHKDEMVLKAEESKSKASIERPVAEAGETNISLSAEENLTKKDVLSPDLSVPADDFEKMELGIAIEESILSSIEKLPLIAQESEHSVEIPENEEEPSLLSAERNGARTFSLWLSVCSAEGFGNYEEVHALDPESPESDSETAVQGGSGEEVLLKTPGTGSPEKGEGRQSRKELIEKFIASEPKIVPSKAEFYSPVTQAKKSVEEHDDLVSETLAAIYRQQGNLARARFCYEKLSLLNPGKSAYFAALVKEIDEELNKSNQEDL
jgi:hypothetical protein